MNISVLFFGQLVDITGAGPESMRIPPASTVAELLTLLFQRWPALEKWEASLLVAVNHEYARRGDSIPEGAEVAIMPPVQGG